MCCIFSNVKLFIKLYFIDTQNPHNFLLVDQIKEESNARAFYDAFFESGPQLLIQYPFVVTLSGQNLNNLSGELGKLYFFCYNGSRFMWLWLVLSFG